MTLPHPKEGSGVLYLLVPQSSQLFEVCRFSDEPRCWFAEDTLIKGTLPYAHTPPHTHYSHCTPHPHPSFLPVDGSVLMCTPMDPLFLALPYVLRATQVRPASHSTRPVPALVALTPLPREGALQIWMMSWRTMPSQSSDCSTASFQANSGSTSAALKACPHCHLPSET